jgi:alpha-amylase
MYLVISATLLLIQVIAALSPAEWRSQSIYFLLTDRFGRDDNSTTAACDVTDRACTEPDHENQPV